MDVFLQKQIYMYLKIEKICCKLRIFCKSQEFFVEAKRKPGFFPKTPRIFRESQEEAKIFFQKAKHFSKKPEMFSKSQFRSSQKSLKEPMSL